MFDAAVLYDHRDLLFAGLAITSGVSAAGIAGGLVLAAPLALLKLSRRPALRGLAAALIEALRNAPFLVLLVLIHFGMPVFLFRLPPWASGVLALSLYGATYFAEVLRGAFLSVPRGQLEAARALGMTGLKGLVTVVLPQMIAPAVPAGRVVAVMLVKESAVLSVITVPELTHAGLRIQSETFATVEVFAALALLYWLVTCAIALGAGLIERNAPGSGRSSPRRSAVAERYLTLDWA